MSETYVIQLPQDNGNKCANPAHESNFPARFTVHSNQETEYLCQHHLIERAHKDNEVMQALSQIGKLTEISAGSFKLELFDRN